MSHEEEHINPTFEWYKAKSKEQGLTPRCPFAGCQNCPGYYLSKTALGRKGFAAKVVDDEQLEGKWKKSSLYPRTDEEFPSINGNKGKEWFSDFCPEVAFDRFHYFASLLYHYRDEIDRDNSYRRLNDESVSPEDWRWQFAVLKPMHYTECRYYSILTSDYSGKQSPVEAKTEGETSGSTPLFPLGEKRWEDLTITFLISNESITVKFEIHDKQSEKISLHELGWENQGRPKQIAFDLCLYANLWKTESKMRLTMDMLEETKSDNMRKRISRIRKKLQEITGKESDPFDQDGNTRDGYQLLCKLDYDDSMYTTGDDPLHPYNRIDENSSEYKDFRRKSLGEEPDEDL